MATLKNAAIVMASAAITTMLLVGFIHTERFTRRIVLTILRNIPTLFLVTTRCDQLSVTHIDDSSWLWGTRRGMSRLDVRTHLGVDLHKLRPGDVRVNGADVAVRLPEAEVLDVVPDLSTWRYVSKASGLQHLRDAVRGRNVRDELKVPAAGEYSSQSYHCSMEVELSDALGAQQIREKIHDTFALVREAVEAELHGVAPKAEGARPALRVVEPTAPAPAGKASNKQIKFILDLAKHRGLGLSEINGRVQQQFRVGSVYELDRKSASALLDELKAAA